MLDIKNRSYSEYLKRRRIYRPNKFRVGIRKYKPLLFSILVLLIIGALLYLAFYIFFLSGKYNINSFDVNGAGEFVNLTDLNQLLEKQLLGKNIIRIDLQKVNEKILTNFLGIKSLNFVKKYPGRILVQVSERIPQAIVCNPNEECFYIDNEGYVLGRSVEDNEEYPVVQYKEDIYIGKILEENIIPVSFEILNSAKNHKVNISSVSYNPQYSEVYVKDGILVLISHDKDKADALKIVAALIQNKTDEVGNIRKIDLRYDKVVVSYD